MLWLLVLQGATPRLDTVWPTSLLGLIGSLTAVLSFFILLVSLWRADKKPVLAKIEEARTDFTKQLARVEKDVEKQLDEFHTKVTGEINGWSKRFEDDHQDIQRHELAIGDQAGRLIRSESDREQLNRRVSELSHKIDKNTEETRELERSMTRTIADTERRILNAIAGRPPESR